MSWVKFFNYWIIYLFQTNLVLNFVGVFLKIIRYRSPIKAQTIIDVWLIIIERHEKWGFYWNREEIGWNKNPRIRDFVKLSYRANRWAYQDRGNWLTKRGVNILSIFPHLVFFKAIVCVLTNTYTHPFEPGERLKFMEYSRSSLIQRYPFISFDKQPEWSSITMIKMYKYFSTLVVNRSRAHIDFSQRVSKEKNE